MKTKPLNHPGSSGPLAWPLRPSSCLGPAVTATAHTPHTGAELMSSSSSAGSGTAVTGARRPLRLGLIASIGLLGGMLSPANAQPLFVRQPTNTIAAQGAIAQFSATATSINPPISYQWWFRDAALDAVANPSAATGLLSITNVTRANAGPYFVVASDSGGAATSQVATLTVDLRSQGIWQRVVRGSGASWPEARGYAGLVYDPNSGRVLLVGGESGWFGDWATHLPGNGGVWALEMVSNQWSLLCNTNPFIADGAAYDTKVGRVIVHVSWTPRGSGSPGLISETWAFDPVMGAWENRHPTRLPPAGLNQSAQIAYNSKSDKVIMFGGYDMANNICRSTTWVYDYAANTWTNMAPKSSPPGRNAHALVYDEAADRVILFGGGDASAYSDTWAYDFQQNTWTNLKPATRPTARIYAYLAYSRAQDRIVLFGGEAYAGGVEGAVNNETWVYDYWANTWTRFTPPVAPSPRAWCAMAYAATADAVILFGGGVDRNHFTDETWSYRLPLRATIAVQAGQVVLNWNGGAPPYSVQSATGLIQGDCRDILTNASPPVVLPSSQPAAFYRVIGQ